MKTTLERWLLELIIKQADEGSVAFMSQLPYANAECAHIVVGRDNTAAGLAPSPTRRFSLKATSAT